MARSIVAVDIVRPSHRLGPLEVEGPDEDAFTLSVHALEDLLGASDPPALDRVHAVGGIEPAMDWAIREALDLPRLEVHHHVGGTTGLFGALHHAAHEPEGSGPSVVLVVDLHSEHPVPTGAGAVAFTFGEGPGASIRGRGQRAHPAHRRPDAAEWAETAARSSGLANPLPPGELLLASEASPPVLLATWARLHPGFPPRNVALPPPWGASRSLGLSHLLAEALRSASPGRGLILARVEPDQSDFLGAEIDAPIAVAESASAAPTHRPGPGGSPPFINLDRVSEGAYVPYVTYRENLPSRWRFVAERCGACGHRNFPARHRCGRCGETTGLTLERLPTSDLEVEAVTTVHPGAQPTEFDPQVERSGAYDVALVRLAPDVRATVQLTDGAPAMTPIGARVSSRIRRLYAMEGEWRYGRKGIRLAPPGA